MRASAVYSDIGYRVEDGDLGYLGDTHASFVARPIPTAAHVRATRAGDAALASIRRILRERQGRTTAGKARPAVDPADVVAFRRRFA